MAEECRGYGTGNILVAFLAGAAIGGVIALLTAPHSGKETRAKIRDGADDLRDRLQHIVAEAEDKIHQTVEEGRVTLQEKKDLVKAVVEAGKGAYTKEQAKHRPS